MSVMSEATSRRLLVIVICSMRSVYGQYPAVATLLMSFDPRSALPLLGAALGVLLIL